MFYWIILIGATPLWIDETINSPRFQVFFVFLGFNGVDLDGKIIEMLPKLDKLRDQL